MSARSARVKAKVLAVLKKNGVLLTGERAGIAEYDPSTLESKAADVSYQVWGLPGAPAYRPTSFDGSGGVIKIGQKLMLASDVEVRVGDRIGLINGVMTVIIGLEPQWLDDEIVKYDVLVTQ
jgi:hypothetical protein